VIIFIKALKAPCEMQSSEISLTNCVAMAVIKTFTQIFVPVVL